MPRRRSKRSWPRSTTRASRSDGPEEGDGLSHTLRNRIQVTLSWPEGWVELPRPGSRGGILRRDPYLTIARHLVAAGAVVPALLRPTRDYLERVAPREES